MLGSLGIEKLQASMLAGILVACVACSKQDATAPTEPSGTQAVTQDQPASSNPATAPDPGGAFPAAAIDAAKADSPPAEVQESISSANGVSLRVADADVLQETLAKHRGKIVLVDCWATWCAPCIKSFPHTVELSRKHADQLAVISLSFDDVSLQQKVLQFLDSNQAQFDNLISKHGGGIEAFATFEIEGGGLPYYKLYDRNGTLRYQFHSGAEQTPTLLKIEELDHRIEELLAAGS